VYNALVVRPPCSGVERAVLEVGRALARRGCFFIHFVLPSWVDCRTIGRRPELSFSSPQTPSRSRLLRILWEQFVLPARVQQERAAILHSPAYVAPFSLRAASVVSVYDLHVYTHSTVCRLPNRLHYRALLPGTLRRAAAILVPSEHTRRALAARFPGAAHKARVVPLGVSADFSPDRDPPRRARLRERLRIPAEAPFVLSVGDLTARKNLPAVVEVLSRLREPCPDLHAVFAGAAMPDAPDLETLAGRCGVGDRIRLPGYVTDADLRTLYSSALALVHPSLDEGFGLPFLEAMACGCPVIACGPAGREVAADAALVCEVGDDSALASAVFRLHEEPDLCERLTAAGLRRAREATWDRTAARVEDVYRDVLAR
jgi:alpha-1,3-rhamnosyl/mannosyltransferase